MNLINRLLWHFNLKLLPAISPDGEPCEIVQLQERNRELRRKINRLQVQVCYYKKKCRREEVVSG